MKFLAVLCKVLGYVWLVISVIIVLVGITGVWLKEGFSGVQTILSPFNFVNWFLTLVTIAPGIGLLVLSDKLRAKTKRDKADSR